MKTAPVRFVTRNTLISVSSSTAYSQVLRPLGKFATDEAVASYPSMTAGDMMQEELRAINLAA